MAVRAWMLGALLGHSSALGVFFCSGAACFMNGFNQRRDNFDDRVFNLESTLPSYSRSPVSGTTRFYGSDITYSESQRQAWVDACGVARQRSMREFRVCFFGKRDENVGELARKRQGPRN